MSNVRQRNKGNKKPAKEPASYELHDEDDKYAKGQQQRSFFAKLVDFVVGLVKCAICLAAMAVVVVKYAEYAKTLHENQYWFSKMSNVEREISLRTESGLYYSYFKYLTTKPALNAGLVEGISQLINDNRTECWRSINVLERFNIFQEILLASWFSLSTNWQALVDTASYETSQIYFYLNTVFNLHGLYLGIVFLIACSIGKSAFGAFLCVVFFVLNK